MLARDDPLWAILTDPKKKGRRWELNEFYATGYAEVEAIMKRMELLGIRIKLGKALDFGCGVGRLTRPLAERFREVCGIDISPTMIELAKEHVKRDNCQFILNPRDDLSVFEDNEFDFICSLITLQHIKPVYSYRYIREFVRVLAPEGSLFFQIPESDKAGADEIFLHSLVPRLHRLSKKYRTKIRLSYLVHRWKRWRKSSTLPPRMEMHRIPRERVNKLIEDNGGRVVACERTSDPYLSNAYLSTRYYVKKKELLAIPKKLQ